jgi:two-component system, sensor histidine kinase
VADQDRSPTKTDSDWFEGLRVLYADDRPEMQRAVERLLRAAGASVTIAQDGLEATEIASTERFDLIVMDLRMPRMDGFEAARVLRATGYRLPLLAVTADATAVVRANALAAGFDAVHPKPFVLRDLADAMRLVHERQSAAQDPGAAP